MIEVVLGLASGLGLAYAISNGRWHRLLALLLLAILLVGYLVHVKVVKTTVDFATFDQAYIRLALAFAIGFMCYWIGFLAIDPVARATPMSQGVQSVIRSLILAVTIFSVLLALYVGPPFLVRQLTKGLHQADIMGLKFSFREMGSAGSDRRGGQSSGSRTDHSYEPFAPPFREIGLAVNFLDTVRWRNDQQYFDTYKIAQSWNENAKASQQAFAKVYVPAASCLHFLKLRSLSSQELDGQIADTNQLIRELLQLNLFVPLNKDSKLVELRPKLDEAMRLKLLDASNRVFDALSARWNDVKARYAETLYRRAEGDQAGSEDNQAANWQFCDQHAKLSQSVRQGYIDRSLQNLDLRQDHIIVLSSFFSLFIGDRPHALQRFDRWIEAVFRSEVDAVREHHLVGPFSERAKSYCERSPGPGDVGEKALLICLTYARVSAHQKSVIDLYDDATPAKAAAQFVLAKQAFETYESLYKGMEKAIGDDARKSCKKLWVSVCSDAQLKMLTAIAITGNGMVHALSQLSADIPDDDVEIANRYCRELWSGDMDGILSAVAQLQRKPLWHPKGAMVDSCGRWELRRAQESAWLDATAMKSAVERLQPSITEVKKALKFWESTAAHATPSDQAGIFAKMQEGQLEPGTLSYSFRQLHAALTEARDVLQEHLSEL